MFSKEINKNKPVHHFKHEKKHSRISSFKKVQKSLQQPSFLMRCVLCRKREWQLYWEWNSPSWTKNRA